LPKKDHPLGWEGASENFPLKEGGKEWEHPLQKTRRVAKKKERKGVKSVYQS